MAAPRKYPDELRERAIRLTLDARKNPAARAGACARIGEQLGINAETLRGWVTHAEVDEGGRPGTTSTDKEKLDKLEREVTELRRANAILASASAFFARSSTAPLADPRLRRAAQNQVRSRADLHHADRGGCQDLSEHLLRRQGQSAVGTGRPR